MREVIFLLIFLCCFLPQQLKAGAAEDAYTRRDYAAAGKAFSEELRNNGLSAVERAQLFKMLGICQYMQGLRLPSLQSFQRAKALNPYIKITPSEADDYAVIELFDSIQAAAPAPAASIPASAPSESVAKKVPSKRPVTTLPKTATPMAALAWLTLSSAVPIFEIYVDGIYKGKGPTTLELNPGFHTLRATAAGRIEIMRTMLLTADEQQSVVLDFRKLPPGTKDVVLQKELSTSPKQAKTNPVESPKRRRILDGSRSQEYKLSAEDSTTGPLWLALLPFGIGQFADGKPLLGFGFALAELGAVGVYYHFWHTAEQSVDATNSYIAEREEQKRRQDYGGLTAAEHQAQTLATVAAYEEQTATDYERADWALGTFAALWVLGATEALLYEPDPAASLSFRPLFVPQGVMLSFNKRF